MSPLGPISDASVRDCPCLIEQREIGHLRSNLWPKLLHVRKHRLGCAVPSPDGQTDERADDCTGDDAIDIRFGI